MVKLKILILFILIFFYKSIFSLNIDSIQKQIFIAEQNNDLKIWIEAHLELEEYYFSNDSSKKAESICDKIIKNSWRKTIKPTENGLMFRTHWYKAFYQKDKGKILNAKTHFEKSLKYYINSSKLFQEDLLVIYPPLGNIYTILGDNENAILIHKKMIEITSTVDSYSDKSNDLAVAYTNLAIVYESQNKNHLALKTIKNVFVLKNVNKNNLAIAYSNYGNFLYKNKQFVLAEKNLKTAIGIFNTIKKRDNYFLGGIYKTLAQIEIKKNNKEKAEKHFNTAIKQYKISKTKRNREISKIYLEKYKLNRNNIEFLDSSLQYLIPHKANFLSQFIPNKSDLFAENTLSEIFYEASKLDYNPEKKIIIYELYFSVQKLLRKEYLFKNSKQESLKQDKTRLNEIIEFCFIAYSNTKNEKFAEKAVEFIENEKSILLYEYLATNSFKNKTEAYNEYLNNKKKLINDLINAKLNNEKTKIEEIKININELEYKNELLTTKNTDKLSEFNITNFKNKLLANEILLVFYEAKDIYSIFISEGESVISKINKNEDLLKSISEFSSFFSFKNRNSFNSKTAEQLAISICNKTGKDTKKIYLSTDGILNNLPFDALIKNNKYFVELYNIQYIFSANILQNIKIEKNGNNEILAVAPIFKNNKKKYLKKSEEEVDNIIKLLKGKKILNRKASYENFISYGKEYSIIHISSHAMIDKKLKTATIDFYDKSIYFSQIKQESFESDLMVLSACETGIGKNEIGEGSMSLSRAFAYTNIPSIISSLWKVNEESTFVIFNDFYKNLLNKKSISVSLRNAKLSYLYNNNLSDEKKLPYYWASFIFTGKDNILNLKKSNYNSKIIIQISIIAILLIFLLIYLKSTISKH